MSIDKAITFRNQELSLLVQEITNFLNGTDFPTFNGILFCLDGELLEFLDEGIPWHQRIFRKPRVPKRFFRNQLDFQADFDHYRLLGVDWMHLKIHGVLEGTLLISLQCPEVGASYDPAKLSIRVTKIDPEPPWIFVD